MKHDVSHTSHFIADLLILAAMVTLNPLLWQKPTNRGIADKIEIVTHYPLKADSTELEELRYYLRNHTVTDEGYNLIARHYSLLLRAYQQSTTAKPYTTRRLVRASERLLPAVVLAGGHWKAGRYQPGRTNGHVILRDRRGRIVRAFFDADTIVYAKRTDSLGTYSGQMDTLLRACGQGSYDALKGCHYEGFFSDDRRHGFGFESSPLHQVRVGQWKNGRFLGERLKYTNDRIYGIDISRHQHEKGRRRYGINWRRLRITSLGRRHQTDGRTFPVSFIYIKSTEGTSVRNRYFLQDYMQAHKHGIKTGAYHFFSMKSSALEQATYFVNHTLFRQGDFPPVLDVEPTDAQIAQAGGDDVMMQRIRTFMQYVERRTGMRPILYVNQAFVNNHMQRANDIKQRYNVWIARYGQYKPDVKLAFWQLCADGRVQGITGDVDINVFNGYQGQFDEFIRTGFHR